MTLDGMITHKKILVSLNILKITPLPAGPIMVSILQFLQKWRQNHPSPWIFWPSFLPIKKLQIKKRP